MKSTFLTIGVATFVFLGVVLFATFKSAPNRIKYSGETIMELIKENPSQFHADSLSKISDYYLVDVSSKQNATYSEFQGYVRIAFPQALDEANEALFRSDKIKILIGEDPLQVNALWTLLHQIGYSNIYVLKN